MVQGQIVLHKSINPKKHIPFEDGKWSLVGVGSCCLWPLEGKTMNDGSLPVWVSSADHPPVPESCTITRPEESIGSMGWMGQGSHPESTGGITHGCPLAGILASLAANLAGLASQPKIT